MLTYNYLCPTTLSSSPTITINPPEQTIKLKPEPAVLNQDFDLNRGRAVAEAEGDGGGMPPLLPREVNDDSDDEDEYDEAPLLISVEDSNDKYEDKEVGDEAKEPKPRQRMHGVRGRNYDHLYDLDEYSHVMMCIMTHMATKE